MYGNWRRYLYDGERVLQDLTDDGDWRTTYTVENGSYQGMLLGIKRLDQESERFPLYDSIGSALGLVDENGSVTDSYALDTFGTPSGPAEGSTPNPYRFGGAWGYITDPSGLLQLGARFYWPEIGRFVSQDPIASRAEYVYSEGSPVGKADPSGMEAHSIANTRGVRDCIRALRGASKEIDAGLNAVGNEIHYDPKMESGTTAITQRRSWRRRHKRSPRIVLGPEASATSVRGDDPWRRMCCTLAHELVHAGELAAGRKDWAQDEAENRANVHGNLPCEKRLYPGTFRGP